MLRLVHITTSPAAAFFFTLEHYLQLKYDEHTYDSRAKRTLLTWELLTFTMICAILLFVWNEELPLEHEKSISSGYGLW